MPAPIALFAFNRPSHLTRVLDALAANELASESPLTIFCDGPRTNAEKSKTDVVRGVARAEASRGRFASVCVHVSSVNKGLASSLIAGINTMLSEHERVIVLEDDLTTSPYFLRYMNDGLDVYANNSKVASIHGYMYPHIIEPELETFFLRGADCWGWATWRRAWVIFNPNAVDLQNKMYQAQEVDAFNRHGAYNYMAMLQAHAEGKISSWAVRWLASSWLADMYTLYPAVSLVQQIGLDASGTHCGVNEDCHVPLALRPIAVVEIDVAEDERMALEFTRWIKLLSNTQMPPQAGVYSLLRKYPTLYNFFWNGGGGLKDCIPSIIIHGLKKLLRKDSPPPATNIWQGDYPDWESASAACSGGYDSDAIFQKVVAAARKVRDGEALWERDSVCFYHEEYNWHLIASLMHIAALQGGSLHVLDFGGALGSTYRQHQKFLDALPDFSWNIVEQAHVVACGEEEFTTEKLHFYPNMDVCFKLKKINCVLFSSVLQYLPEPYVALEAALCRAPFSILIDRTPFVNDDKEICILKIQTPKSIYHNTSYPIWFLSQKMMNKCVFEKHKYIQMLTFCALDGEYEIGNFLGLLFIRGNNVTEL